MTGVPASTADPPDASTIAIRLHSVAIHLLRRLRREDEALGVSASCLSALSVVGFGGPRSLGELAAAEQVTPPTMTRIVATLAREGLVRRGADPSDRRVVRIEATARGRRVLERGRRRRTERLAADLQSLAPDDLAVVGRAAALLDDLLRSAGH
jgi:DNA-binding MarR family transcriptional regulator